MPAYRIIACLLLSALNLAASELDRIIAPEIKNDPFYEAIYRLSKEEKIQTILEIGSSSGDGSTEAFVKGLLENPHHPILFCIEISEPRFILLKNRYAHLNSIRCYNVSSIGLQDFPTEEEIKNFLINTPTNLNIYGLNRVIGWLRQDINYVKENNMLENGIVLIKSENNIDFFDMVLIDGSEFTGKAELKLVYGARFILLDDINAFKNYNNYHELLRSEDYELIEINITLRNGYAIFKKK